MKKINRIILICFILLVAEISIAQTLSPKVAFKENPQTHNMHLTSDGQFLYTCNGGKSELGQISKLNPDGSKISSYKIELDMRSIMYNSSDKKLYVNTYGQKLYRIDDLVAGDFTEVADFSDRNEQCSAALSVNGKLIYFMEFGEVYVYTFKTGKLKTTLSGLKTADEASLGGTAVAVDKKNIFCWNTNEKTVYIYDLKGRFQKSVKLAQGDYGFSLSFANDLLWVSTDGNYDEGTWYGYEIK
jgi:6-phosphogluconolactonase (cycloisomerase 2 family)